MIEGELGRGAEAIVTKKSDAVEKLRPVKTYRHPELDLRLRKSRTRKEAKVLKDLEAAGISAPKLISVDEKQGSILMEQVKGQKLRDVLDNQPQLSEQVGRLVARLHDMGIMHGDLTTSNMILRDDGVVALIDFGLSFHSTRIEDRAVDLHLFKQALASKHHRITQQAWRSFLKGYEPKDRDEILKRLRVVERRGRNKE